MYRLDSVGAEIRLKNPNFLFEILKIGDFVFGREAKMSANLAAER